MLAGEELSTAFSNSQLAEMEKALLNATRSTGAWFTAYVGALPAGHQSAVALHDSLEFPNTSVLVAVDPEQRLVEVITGSSMREALDDRACRLACLTMTSRFTVGDIAAGIRDGVVMLADHARPLPSLHTDLPD